MIKKLKNIKLRTLLIHLIVTLAYPAAKGIRAPLNGLQLFTDAMTIIAIVLILIGLLYSFYLHGDFDVASYAVRRGMKRGQRGGTEQEAQESFQQYVDKMNEEREEAFNYPLFLGLVYLAVSAVIAYSVL